LSKVIEFDRKSFQNKLILICLGPSWPCAGKILQNWIPKAKFGTAWSILSTSSNIAGAIGPYLATIFALNFHWSYGFMIPGVISMTFGFMSILLLRNKPSDVKMTDYGGGNQMNNDKNEDEEEFSRWQQTVSMFKYPYFISLCVCYFTVQLVKTLFSDWTQLYLIKAIKINNYTGNTVNKALTFNNLKL
jgi:OPA family sugar phosphate sensor protein UhpC-like MFS transporter